MTSSGEWLDLLRLPPRVEFDNELIQLYDRKE
jgi:hypothetical protein